MKPRKVLSLLLSLLFVLALVPVPALAANFSTQTRYVNAGESGDAAGLTGVEMTGDAAPYFTTSDPLVFRIDREGNWKALKAGTATVVAHYSYGLLTNTYVITVYNTLRKENFNFNVKVDGYSNYIDHIENYHTDWQSLDAIVQTTKGTEGDYEDHTPAGYYMIPMGWTPLKGLRLDRNGITFGDSEEKVFNLYGRMTKSPDSIGVLRTNLDHDPWVDQQNIFDQAVEEITYTDYVDNHFFCQRYYFNEQKKVCMIAWFIST